MIRKEWKRMLALSMTYIMTLSVAAPVKAAEEELGVPIAGKGVNSSGNSSRSTGNPGTV
mgnify:CR=1 FL=1